MIAGVRRDLVLGGVFDLAAHEVCLAEQGCAETRERLAVAAAHQTSSLLCEAVDRSVHRLALRRSDLQPTMVPITRRRLESNLRSELLTAAAELAGGLDRQVRLALCAELERFLELAVTLDQLAQELGMSSGEARSLVSTIVQQWHHHQRLRDMRNRQPENEEERLQACFQLGVLGACLPTAELLGACDDVPWSRIATAGDVAASLRAWLRERSEKLADERGIRIEVAVRDWVDDKYVGTVALTLDHIHRLLCEASTDAPVRVDAPSGVSS